MKNILDSRKIIDTKNQESLLKQIEAKVKDNNVSVLEDLLENLASLDNSLLNQVSKIWDLAVEHRRAEALEELLENTEFKKNINVTNSTRLTPLMHAAKLDNASAVRKLLVAGAECEILPVFSSEKTVLDYAIESGKARVLRVLINSKLMSLEILNELLMLAVLKNNSDAIKVLLKAGADITVQITENSKGLDGVTALHIAASLNKIEVLELLLKHKDIKKVLNIPGKNGLTPLMRAASKGHADTVGKLIEAGADIATQVTGNSNVLGGYTALYIAASLNKIEVLELLLKHEDIKKVLNLPNEDGYTGYTPLMDAASKGHADAVSRLIEAGADVTIQVTGNSEWNGYTALHIAASLNKIEVLELLLKHQDIREVLNLPGKNGFTPLIDAASKGHAGAVSKLIEAGADITIQVTGNSEWNGYTALHIAASLNKIEVLELLLKHQDIREVLNLPGKNGFTPLIDAASKGHADAVSKLIEAGADIIIQVTGNSNGWNGYTALHIAVFYNKMEVLKLLLKHQDIRELLNLPSKDGFTPLMDAAEEGHADAVSKLIESGADITIQVTGNSEWNGYTALHIAAFKNKIGILELLLKHKDIREVLNLPNKNGFTPLMDAAKEGHTDAISRLIEAGADITAQITGNSNGWDGYTALHIAASLNKIEVLELLLKHKDIREVLNLPDKDGFTPLMDTAYEGHADAVSRLIKAGADVTIQVTGNSNGWDGSTALHIAAFKNKIGILELLLKHQDIKKVLNLPGKNGFTPLMDAAKEGHADAVSRLIKAGADVTIQVTGNSKGWGGYTALHIAAFKNKIGILELLLKNQDIKKVLNLPNEDGYTGFTPLMDAAMEDHTDTVSRLIEAGADITIQVTGNSNVWGGSTALHIAASLNKTEILELLLKHQDIREVLNLPDKNGFTPLMDAAYEGHADAVSRLIEAGADVTIQVTGNSDGWDGSTALHIAVSKNKIEVLELLLKHQDIREVLNLPNKNGYTPLMRAALKGHTDTVSRLIEAGADITVQITGNSDGWDGSTALHIAASKNKIEVLELLLKHQDIREVLNLPDRDGYTPLMRAALKGHTDTVGKLIEAGTDITAQNHKKNTAAHLAAKYQKGKSLGMLIDKAPKVLEMLNETGHTPGELLSSRQKRSSSEVSIFSNGAEGGGKQKRRRIQTNSGNWWFFSKKT